MHVSNSITRSLVTIAALSPSQGSCATSWNGKTFPRERERERELLVRERALLGGCTHLLTAS